LNKTHTKLSVVVVTQIVTPYHTELFDAVYAHGAIDLRVIYVDESASFRDWQQYPRRHPHIDLAASGSPGEQAASVFLAGADLAIFGTYQQPCASRWIRERSQSRKPWCFWGERPGYRFPGLAGRLFRQWRLGPLARSQVPIWGIGQWAIDGYRQEFGGNRQYFNIPYFSDLARFIREDQNDSRQGGPRRFLFSGSLIKRKGVDLLARAFRELARNGNDIWLDIVGDGVMRNMLMRELEPVSASVTFHGFRQWSELPALYARAHVLCVPSRYDGWGLVVPEGLAAGLPVIATDKMGAAVDLLHDGTNGWTVSAGNYDQLYSAMGKALALTNQEMSRMSAAAVHSIANHTLDDGVSRFEQAVQGTLAGCRKK